MEIHPQQDKTVRINQLLSELYNLVETLETQHIRPNSSKPEVPHQPSKVESTTSRVV
jgi:hypothetical protein